MQSILETVPNTELARTWPSSWTIMMRMTSKSIRKAIDNAKLPATVSLIWPKYRNNILKINKIFKLLNITNLNIKCFDFESDFNFECDEDNNQYEQIVKIVEEVEVDNEESIEYDENIEYEEDKLLILSDMFSLNEGITVLNLEYCDLKNNSLKFFTKLQNLSKLNLKGNNFSWSSEFIEVIMMLPKLVCLNLDLNENFNKKGCVISQLSHDQFLHLEELSLNHCNIACGSYDILKLIQICPKLVRLNLDNNGLNEEWMKRLEQALSHCQDLAYLDLNCNCINNVGDLLNSHKLVCLDLSFNKFGDCKTITNAQCSNLTNLNLSSNMIGEEGAANIANALSNAQFPNLTNLYLKWNKIEDAGASKIINAQWSSLTCLDLSYNEIVERKKLKVLQLQCPSLKELILSLKRGCNKYCKCNVSS
jgi:hypothetical protein